MVVNLLGTEEKQRCLDSKVHDQVVEGDPELAGCFQIDLLN
jgi:hypothetical protein